MDATECPIQRPSDNEIQRLYYSGKQKRHTIKYEVAITWTGSSDYRIVWVSRPVPGSVHDLKLARMGWMKNLLPEEKVLADKGYIGESCFVTPFKNPTYEYQFEANQAIGRARIFVEHVMGLIKNFRAMSTRWRHERFSHGLAFKVIAELVNIQKIAHEQ